MYIEEGGGGVWQVGSKQVLKSDDGDQRCGSCASAFSLSLRKKQNSERFSFWEQNKLHTFQKLLKSLCRKKYKTFSLPFSVEIWCINCYHVEISSNHCHYGQCKESNHCDTGVSIVVHGHLVIFLSSVSWIADRCRRPNACISFSCQSLLERGPNERVILGLLNVLECGLIYCISHTIITENCHL